MLLLSVDPGGMTGLAFYDSGGGFFEAEELEFQAAARWIDYKLNLKRADEEMILVCEIFTVNAHTARHSRQYDALELTGVCRYLAHIHDAQFVQQTPAQRKVISNDQLRKLGWYNTSPDKHMIDAAKHLTVACLRRGVLKPEDVRV